MSDEQQPDSRPGRYYISVLPGIGERKDKYWRMAGPWSKHTEALEQVKSVWDYCRDVDPVGTEWKAFGTCRVPPENVAPTSKLGSDPTAWQRRRDVVTTTTLDFHYAVVVV